MVQCIILFIARKNVYGDNEKIMLNRVKATIGNRKKTCP